VVTAKAVWDAMPISQMLQAIGSPNTDQEAVR